MTSKQTAISRSQPSAPMQYLSKQGLLVGEMLDFGCGKGFDAAHYNMAKYDPNWSPETDVLDNKYDIITCNYVLNVIEQRSARRTVLSKIRSLLKEDGVAYITVRRDVKKDGATTKGYQANIELDLEVVKQTSGYCIYKLTST